MNFWLNAQLPPNLAKWLTDTFSVNAVTLQELGLRDAQDIDIFYAARANGDGTVILTKDRDFIDLVVRLGTPPQILWLTCGNMANRELQRIFTQAFPQALELLQNGESIVEIGRI
jgi:predicted nuclease of predicted toxin-antitoxin system